MTSNARYQLVRLNNGICSVRSLADAETFHPVVGPVAEAEALYVNQLRLRERLKIIPANLSSGMSASARRPMRSPFCARRDIAVQNSSDQF